jgi:hypothetical protein
LPPDPTPTRPAATATAGAANERSGGCGASDVCGSRIQLHNRDTRH